MGGAFRVIRDTWAPLAARIDGKCGILSAISAFGVSSSSSAGPLVPELGGIWHPLLYPTEDGPQFRFSDLSVVRYLGPQPVTIRETEKPTQSQVSISGDRSLT